MICSTVWARDIYNRIFVIAGDRRYLEFVIA